DIKEAEEKASIVVIVNPNNPNGNQYPIHDLLALAQRLHQQGGTLVVDGAFEDVMEGAPMSSLAGIEGLVVLRSFGKFFGLAGIRLGFALCPKSLAEQLESSLGPWATSQPAIAAGCAAMNDKKWIEETKIRLQKETQNLDRLLKEASLKIIGGTSLFRLIESPKAETLYNHLGKAGILVRPFVENPDWIRFGLPGNVKNVKRLAEVLETFANSV
ncbi:MAG: aminotransferase class I/II-fold pyridoxal phosphate-dependent enzyme, partial [Alphaproteobacteria bacterium]|nr:aminotransferase class I/II-fold pyridoxal phosphate-dependent enzyme [Alphaproteobacteria bacterium]